MDSNSGFQKFSKNQESQIKALPPALTETHLPESSTPQPAHLSSKAVWSFTMGDKPGNPDVDVEAEVIRFQAEQDHAATFLFRKRVFHLAIVRSAIPDSVARLDIVRQLWSDTPCKGDTIRNLTFDCRPIFRISGAQASTILASHLVSMQVSSHAGRAHGIDLGDRRSLTSSPTRIELAEQGRLSSVPRFTLSAAEVVEVIEAGWQY